MSNISNYKFNFGREYKDYAYKKENEINHRYYIYVRVDTLRLYGRGFRLATG